jgi:hypothetical protein
MKNELNISFQQKFAMGSYGVRIRRAWCSRKACEICSHGLIRSRNLKNCSLVKNKKLKKNYFSSHKLPKQQSTSFWSQGILGINMFSNDLCIGGDLFLDFDHFGIKVYSAYKDLSLLKFGGGGFIFSAWVIIS